MKNLLIGGLVVAAMLVCAQRLCAGEEREIRLKIVHSESGKVLEGVNLHYTLDEKKFENAGMVEKGEYGLAIKDAKQVRFELRKDGFVNESVTFGGEYGIKPIPREYTLKMWPGVEVG